MTFNISTQTLTRLPTDIKYHIYNIFSDEEKLDLLAKVPELYNQYENKSQQVVVIFKKRRERIPKQFSHRYGNVDPFIINVPKAFNGRHLQSRVNSQSVQRIRQELEKLIPEIRSRISLREAAGFEPVLLLDFAFDTESDNCYYSANLYPELFDLVKDIPHSLTIYKSQSDVSKLTKSRDSDYSLFDGVMEVEPLMNIRALDISMSSNSFVKFNPPIMSMRSNCQIRVSTLFHDCDRSVRDEILSVRSNLIGVNIVTPATDVEESEESKSTHEKASELNDKLLETFLEPRHERAFWVRSHLCGFRTRGKDMKNMHLFYDNLQADLSSFLNVFQTAIESFEEVSGQEIYHINAEAFYMLFSDTHLENNKDMRKGRYKWSTPNDEKDARDKKLESVQSLAKELRSTMRTKGRKSSFNEFVVLGKHWLEPQPTFHESVPHPPMAYTPQTGEPWDLIPCATYNLKQLIKRSCESFSYFQMLIEKTHKEKFTPEQHIDPLE